MNTLTQIIMTLFASLLVKYMKKKGTSYLDLPRTADYIQNVVYLDNVPVFEVTDEVALMKRLNSPHHGWREMEKMLKVWKEEKGNYPTQSNQQVSSLNQVSNQSLDEKVLAEIKPILDAILVAIKIGDDEAEDVLQSGLQSLLNIQIREGELEYQYADQIKLIALLDSNWEETKDDYYLPLSTALSSIFDDVEYDYDSEIEANKQYEERLAAMTGDERKKFEAEKTATLTKLSKDLRDSYEEQTQAFVFETAHNATYHPEKLKVLQDKLESLGEVDPIKAKVALIEEEDAPVVEPVTDSLIEGEAELTVSTESLTTVEEEVALTEAPKDFSLTDLVLTTVFNPAPFSVESLLKDMQDLTLQHYPVLETHIVDAFFNLVEDELKPMLDARVRDAVDQANALEALDQYQSWLEENDAGKDKPALTPLFG